MDTLNNFYRDIAPFNDFSHVFDSDLYHAAPDDWYVVLADVKGSTLAVSEGRYKQVNIVGASCIIAVLNAVKHDEIPFVFGGDGASFLVPKALMHSVAVALAEAQNVSKEVFNLELRVGAVPLSKLSSLGKSVKVAKYAVSEFVHIAMFDGGGLSYAEDLIKHDEDGTYGLYQWIDGEVPETVDFSGLECRWNPIKASKDKVLTLMVLEREEGAYEDVMEHIRAIYSDERPVQRERMSLSLRWKFLKQEYAIKARGLSFGAKLKWLLALYFETFLGICWFRLDFKLGETSGQKYVSEVVSNTDYQKFDDTLRVILDSTNEQAASLRAYLEEMYQQGKIYYGKTLSASILMTCLIFERSEKHLHFVDGMDGGYTLAAKEMKTQMQKAD